MGKFLNCGTASFSIVEPLKHAKQISNNKAAVGDAEEESNLEDVEFVESSANPSPDPVPTAANRPEVATTRSATSVTPTHKMKRHHGTASKKREAKKNEFVEMHRLNLLSMQESQSAEKQQQREQEQRANRKIMQMIGTPSLASTAAAWAT